MTPPKSQMMAADDIKHARETYATIILGICDPKQQPHRFMTNPDLLAELLMRLILASFGVNVNVIGNRRK